MRNEHWNHVEALWRVLSKTTSEAQPFLGGLGLTPKAFFVLSALRSTDSPTALSEITQSPRSTITSVLSSLEAKGLAERRPVGTDLRRWAVVLTATGEAAIEKGKAAMDAAFARRLSALSGEERAQFASLLDRLNESITEQGEKPTN